MLHTNFISRVAGRSICAAYLAVGLASSALAGWTFTDIHPVGATNSYARGIRNGKIVGSVDGNATTWTLNVAGSISLGAGNLLRTDGVQQAGTRGIQPAVWTGSLASYLSLATTPSINGGTCNGVFNGEQVGSMFFNSLFQYASSGACYWLDSPGTIGSLHPVGAAESACEDVYAGQEVGGVRLTPTSGMHAAVWYGSPAYVDLNPIGASESYIYGVVAGKQVGSITVFYPHAARWSNTAASCVDLHPAGAGPIESTAKATYLGKQAGWARYVNGDTRRAAFWADTAASYKDLHTVLTGPYSESEAEGIWTDNAGVNTYVTGNAKISGQRHAIIWKKTPDQTISSTIHLNDTVSPFAAFRIMNYTLYKNAVPVASGQFATNAPNYSLSIDVDQTITGGGLLVIDGSSFLRRAYSFVLTGNNQNLGQINVSNGDADLNGEVDAADIDLVIADFGSMAVGNSDVDVSGEVDAADIDIVIASFGLVDQ